VDKDLNEVLLAMLVHSNLSMLEAFIAVGPTLPAEAQQTLFQSLDKVKKSNQAVLDIIVKTSPAG
jgi:hypothetical protein